MKVYRVRLLFFAVLFLSSTLTLFPFGKNKVDYEAYDWHILKTPHCDIYYDEGFRKLAEEVAKIAEEAVSHHSVLFEHTLEKVIPIVVYPSTSAFQQTHLMPGSVGEGTGGFTEFLRSRVAIPFNGSYADLRHVVLHELVHVFQLDIIFGSLSDNPLTKGLLRSPPLWLMEGGAEFGSRTRDTEMDMYIRDGILTENLPTLMHLENPYTLGPYYYFVYKGSEAFLNYAAQKYGTRVIAEITHTLRVAGSGAEVVNIVFKKKLRKVNDDWVRYLKRKYWPLITRYDPLDLRDKKYTDHFNDKSTFNAHPAFSADGEYIYLLSNRFTYPKIIVLDATTGKYVKTIVSSMKEDAFEYLHALHNVISFSDDGARMIFASKTGSGDAINLYDARRSRLIEQFRPPFTGLIFPRISRDGKEVVFTGISNDRADLYIMQLHTGTYERLTDDRFFETKPSFSKDGTKILFSANRNDEGDYYSRETEIFVFDRMTREVTPLTASEGENNAPDFSPNNEYIVFSSDRTGIFNLYVKNITNGRVYKITETYGGCFEPRFNSKGTRITYTGYQEAGQDIYGTDLDLVNNTYAIRDERYDLLPEKETLAGATASTNDTNETAQATGGTNGVTNAGGTFVDAFRTEPTEAINKGRDRHITKNIVTDTTTEEYGFNLKPDIAMFSLGFSSSQGGGGDLYLSLADMLNHHQILTYLQVGYYDDDFQLNGFLSYLYLPMRIDIGVQLYHYKNTWYQYVSGDYTVIDSYTPFWEQRLGMNVLVRFPINTFNRFDLFINPELYRKQYESPPTNVTDPTLYENKDVRIYLAELVYVHDSTLWGMLTPMDNSRSIVTLQHAIKVTDKAYTYSLAYADLRKYFMIGRTSLALRAAGGKVFGEDKEHRLFRLGGITTVYSGSYADYVTTIRGFKHGTLSGENAALASVELRVPLIDRIQFGFPFPFVFGNVTGVFFADFGMAWNDADGFNAMSWHDADGLTFNQMKSSVGFGVRFIVPPFFLFSIDFPYQFYGNDLNPHLDENDPAEWDFPFFYISMRVYDF